MLDQLLNTAEDLVVLGRGREEGKYEFVAPFVGDIAKQCFDKSVSDKSDRKLPAFNGYWGFNDGKGLIIGSGTNLNLRLDKQLRQDGLWLPTVAQGLALDRMGKLTNDVYRDFGIVVYNEDEPNKKTAEKIIGQVERETPLIISFRDLDYKVVEDDVEISLVENPIDIVSGKKAEKMLENFYKCNKVGACGVGRDWDDDWVACWHRFGFSDSVGRVDYVCGEATRADLEGAQGNLLDRTYGLKIKRLEAERDERQEAFSKTLS